MAGEANVVEIAIRAVDLASAQLKAVEQSLGDLVPVADKVTVGVKAAGSEMQKTATGPVTVLEGTLANLAAQGSRVFGMFGPLVLSLGGVGAALGLVGYAAKTSLDHFTAFGEKIRELSFLSGASAKDTSILVSGLEQIGVSTGAVEVGLRMMSMAVERGSPALNKLGIQIVDANGKQKTGLALFYETVDALRSMTNETERNHLAQQMFGRSFLSLIQALEKGSGVIKELGIQSGRLASPEDLERIKAYELAIARLSASVSKLWEDWGRGFVIPITFALGGGPSTTDVLKSLLPWTEAYRKAAAGAVGPAGRGPESVTEIIPGPIGGTWPSVGHPAYDIQKIQRDIFESQTAEMAAKARAGLAAGPLGAFEGQAAALRAAYEGEQAAFEKTSREAGLTEEQKNARLAAMTLEHNAKVLALTRSHNDALQKLAETISREIYNEQANADGRDLVRITRHQTDIQHILMESGAAESQIMLARIKEEETRAEELRKAYFWHPDVQAETGAGGFRPPTQQELTESFFDPNSAWTVSQRAFQDKTRMALPKAALDMGGAQFLPVAQWQEQMRLAGETLHALGFEQFDALTERINATRNAITALVASMQTMTAAERASVAPSLIEMQARLNDLNQTATARNAFNTMFDSFSQGLNTSINGVLMGTQTLAQAFDRMRQTLALSLGNMLVQDLMQSLKSMVEKLLFPSGGSPSPGSSGGLILPIVLALGKAIASIFAPAASIPSGPLTEGAFQTGGFVRGPTLAMLGEGGDTELVLPLHNRQRTRELLALAGRMNYFQEGGMVLSSASPGPLSLPFDSDDGGGTGGSPSQAGGDVTVINLTRPEELDGLIASAVARGSRVVVNEVIQGLAGNQPIRRIIQRTR